MNICRSSLWEKLMINFNNETAFIIVVYKTKSSFNKVLLLHSHLKFLSRSHLISAPYLEIWLNQNKKMLLRCIETLSENKLAFQYHLDRVRSTYNLLLWFNATLSSLFYGASRIFMPCPYLKVQSFKIILASGNKCWIITLLRWTVKGAATPPTLNLTPTQELIPKDLRIAL